LHHHILYTITVVGPLASAVTIAKWGDNQGQLQDSGDRYHGRKTLIAASFDLEMGAAYAGLDSPPRFGDGMALVGLPVLLWWLAALAGGPGAYADFIVHAMSWYGIVVLVGLSWAFFNHMSSGLRHFVLDIGAGYELDTNKRYSLVSMAVGIILTAAFWAAIFAL
jgi:succinate dehydrogenase / fumarate reductase, cytochrome b subunit